MDRVSAVENRLTLILRSQIFKGRKVALLPLFISGHHSGISQVIFFVHTLSLIINDLVCCTFFTSEEYSFIIYPRLQRNDLFKNT
jgi:hypothetical protein